MSPIPDSHAAAPQRYYKSTLSGLTYRELWNFGSVWNVLIIWLMKACGQDVLLSQGAPEPVRLEQMRVDPSQIRPDLLAALEKMVTQAHTLGFREPIYYKIPQSLIVGSEAAGVTCLHPANETFANLIAAKNSQELRAVASFVTGYADGSFFSSGNDKTYFLQNPRNGVLALPKATAAEVFARHEKARRSWAKGRKVRTVSTEAELADALFDYEQSSHQWHVGRGAYVQMTEEEVASARRQHACAHCSADTELSELSCSLAFVNEESPSKVPEGVTLTGTIVAEAIRAATCASSEWLLTFSAIDGTTLVEMTLEGSLLELTEGEVLEAKLRQSRSSSGKPLMQRLQQLLGEQVLGDIPKVQELPAKLTFISRSAPTVSTQTKLAGEHVFRMELPGVPGSFELVLHPALSEGRIKPGIDLDRAAAVHYLAGLLS